MRFVENTENYIRNKNGTFSVNIKDRLKPLYKSMIIEQISEEVERKKGLPDVVQSNEFLEKVIRDNPENAAVIIGCTKLLIILYKYLWHQK